MRGYTLLRDVRGKGAASALRLGLSRPNTHDEERSCPSTLIRFARAESAPGTCRPGPALGATFPPRPQRQDLRVPTPTQAMQ